MVGSGLDSRAYGERAERRCDRREHRSPEIAQLVVSLRRHSGDAPGAVVEHDDRLDLVQLSLVREDVLLRAEEALLLAAEQHEPDSSLRAHARRFENARRLEHGDGTGAVVGPASGEIPRIEMRPEDHDFAGALAAANLTDGVVGLERVAAEAVLDIRFDAHR